METTPTRVISYFDGEKQHLIPLFQRPYTWDDKKWKILWEDVMVQYPQNQAESETEHFMGAIVSAPVVSVPVGVQKFLVIDGQQRLITISIFLAVLRDVLKEKDSVASQKIHNLFLTNQYAQDNDNLLKIVPTNSDRDLYRRIIFGEDLIGNDKASLMVKAYKFFQAKLKSTVTDEDNKKVNPSRVLEVLEKNLRVVMINLGEKDDPYLIFESLNFKGQPLTQADLVRNYILMKFRHSIQAGGEQEKIYNTYWKPIEECLDNDQNMLTIFLQSYVKRNGKNVLARDMYIELKSIIEKLTSADAIEKEIGQIKRYFNYFKTIIAPDESEIGQRLQAIVDLKIRKESPAYPLLLKLFEKQAENKMADGELLACLMRLESFIVRRSICGISQKSLNIHFLSWCAQMPENTFDDWLWERMSKGTGSAVFPSDEDVKKAFLEQKQYNAVKSITCKHILWSLEKTFQHKEEIADSSKISIEHVMPQELSKEWKNYLGKNWHEIHKEYLHTFGNLTLTGYNSELSNAPFDEKKRTYADSHFELTLQIATNERWGIDEIKKRAGELALKAISLWPGPQTQ